MKHCMLLVGFVVTAGLACSGGVPPVTEVTPPIAPDVDTALAIPVDARGELPSPAEETPPPPPPDRDPDAEPEAAPVAPPPPPEDDEKGAKKPPAPAPSGIEQVSAQSWTVTQALVDRWHEDPYRLSNVREQGDGWELLGVRQRNAYHLGMRNKDVLLEVNGHKLNTRAQLLMTYLACKNDREFDLVFLRQGKRFVHHYAIQR